MKIRKKTLLKFNELYLKFNGRVVLDRISGSVCYGDRIGLVGLNGSGKTSLLKLISGMSTPNFGSVISNVRVTYISSLDLNLLLCQKKVFEYIKEQYAEWWDVLLKYKSLFNSVLDENQKISTLSGGEIMKLNLSRAFVSEPRLVLLDEPTNHLDSKSVKDLETLLAKGNVPYILVSHNHRFLNRVVKVIWELEKGKINIFGGNYDLYQLQKKNLAEKIHKDIEVLNKKIKQKAMIASKKLSQARSLHQKVSSRNPYARKLAGKKSRTAKILADKVQKETNLLNEAKKALLKKSLFMDINESKNTVINQHSLLLKISNGNLVLPNKKTLLSSVNFRLYYGDRVAILGKNGTGKTMFVKQLSYDQRPRIVGDVIYGEKYNTSYVDQKYDLVDLSLSVIDNMKSNYPDMTYQQIRTKLGNVGFHDLLSISEVAKDLSGGELARLAFAMVTGSNIELLILDEPTNNLDDDTINVIKKALIDYEGSLVVVSHDSSFLDAVGVTRHFEIINRKLCEIY
ncbi:ABC-F family ATP-binding cassette domain-containing protein [Candidatus Dojkabacteria bacterium]|nr:ABC-F family ATP-binding cassette domain-containing protein [Candidatus Dojkabacteria bacterium]